MWTPTSRAQHSRAALRYGSDLTDAEWAILEPLLPPPRPEDASGNGPMRQIVECDLLLAARGLPWDMLPDSFPPP